MRFGHALGQGRSVEEAIASGNAVSEGVWTAKALVALAEENGVEMPIARAVEDVLSGRSTVDDAISALLARPFRAEGP